MEGSGFTAVSVVYEHRFSEENLSTWIDIVRRRHICSQLLAIGGGAEGLGGICGGMPGGEGVPGC